MKRKTIGELIFWGATACALALYYGTAPDGLPWMQTTPNRYWRYLVDMAGGDAILLTTMMASLAGGFLGALVNRYLGWRMGLSAALVWIFLPGVWNLAITGERGVVSAAAVIMALWALNWIGLFVTRKARATRGSAGSVPGDEALGGAADHTVAVLRGKLNRFVSRIILGVAILFAIVSFTSHDNNYGEVASAYARLVVEEAGERIILLNGACDEQIKRETTNRTISFQKDDATLSNLVAWVKTTFPSETNLWLEAEIGPASFADAAVKAHPERFYTMNGQSTTLENWTARWTKMQPYLKSHDPFVPVMRRLFAYEGNYLGNTLQEKGALKEAWELYFRIFDEIHPKNPAACVNLNEMLRRGYATNESTRQRIESSQADYAKLLKDRQKAKRVAEYISHFGPVMRDQKAYDELRERVRKRLEELEKNGEKPEMTVPDLKTLSEWHPEMMTAFQSHDLDKAVRIARAILSRRAWRGFIPAYMVLGEAMMLKGAWVEAEAFMRMAAEATGAAAPPPLVLNDYAEILRQLKRFDEAEKYARRAVEQTDEKNGWIYRLTLAQILRDGGRQEEKVKAEIAALLKSILKHAPKEARELVNREFPN